MCIIISGEDILFYASYRLAGSLKKIILSSENFGLKCFALTFYISERFLVVKSSSLLFMWVTNIHKCASLAKNYVVVIKVELRSLCLTFCIVNRERERNSE